VRSLCLFIALTIPSILPAQADSRISLPLTAWDAETNGLFETWIDRRDLGVLHHPWEASQAGLAATITREVKIPEDWEDGARLHFYMSDDYDATRDPLTEGWLGQINLIGHRFKQLLVNDAVVWEKDVADAATAEAQNRFSVALPKSLKAGSTIRLAFRMEDRVGSGERLPDDHRHVGTTDNTTDEDPWRFWTRVYIGDVVLTPRHVETIAPASMPSLASISSHAGDTKTTEAALPVNLQVRHAPGSEVSVPVVTGIPFPPRAVQSPRQIRLRLPSGAPIPCSASTMNAWPDGSLRWAKVIAVLPPNTAEVLLDIGKEQDSPAAPTPPLSASVKADADGRMVVELGSTDGGQVRIAAPLRIDQEVVHPYVDTTETLSSDEVHVEIETKGMLRSTETEYGRFVFRILAIAGLPVVRIDYRVFNDRAKTLDVSRQSVELHATSTLRPTFGDSGKGWVGACGELGSLLCAIRHFAEQQPKSIEIDGHTVKMHLVDSTDEVPAYRPHEGEAKRHEMWVGLWNDTLSRGFLAANAEWMANPAGLFNADYFCATGALGAAFPHDAERFADLTVFMDKTYGAMSEESFFERGIRDWGDKHYNVEEDSWRNGYYDVQQGFAAEYLMTGKVEWFDRLEAVVRHIIDVDVCHSSKEHPDWVGAIHGYYGADHSTAAPWNPTQRTKGTLAYWRLTGDRDARDAALGVADSALGANRGLGATSVRDHAGILYCLTAAYDETHDPKYLEGARRVAHDAMRRIDPRRGTFGEVHGNLSYHGNVPWMVAQLAEPMYDYYRQSGDRAAAVAVVGMAESILAENRTRGVPGDVFGYSHNPHFKKTSNYHILIAPAILYAYELTKDPEFLRQARAMYAQTIQENTVNSIMNCYWNTPTLLYFLNAHRDKETDLYEKT